MNQARGYQGARARSWDRAKQAVTRAGRYSYRDRRQRKREFRRLWVTRITAACRQRRMRYSRFMAGLRAAGIQLDRRMLSEIAIHDPAGFDAIAEQARQALPEQKEAA
jgi:large subunit ribosomal protein L20